MSKDPCKRFACNLQKCLTDNNFQESACQKAIEAIVDCCKTWKDSSIVCSGIKISKEANEAKQKVS